MDDDLPTRRDDPVAAVLRQDIDSLSRDELDDRIDRLREEIARCEARKSFATTHRNAADKLFGS